MSLLEVDALHVTHGKAAAVADVSFVARPGVPLAILGRNGAGKSSLLGAIAGLVRPSSGRVCLDDVEVTGWSPDRRARTGMALVPEGRRIFPALTVRENLRLGGFASDGEQLQAAMDRVVALFPVLGERIDAPAGRMSGGEQQMLAVGRALMAQPRVLLLDEPSLGLAPRAIADVYEQLQALQAEGLTIVIVEQQARRALAFAGDAIVLHEGRIVAHQEPAGLLDDSRLLAAYMGTRPT